MFKFLVMLELFSSILCRALTNASYVENNLEIRKSYPIVPVITPEYSKISTDIQGKTYHSGYGTAITPTYPAVDPLSVLASLAFLAFLLQSLIPLFDRSRSIRSATATARHFMELKILALTTQVLRALEKYGKNSDERLLQT
ncbi:uncharacterized protein LOC143188530 [Calliopsis andreniformis]|uniref:uncharacterized protein LOC143188530 n=1 Tax=Calliopsis andreniformis TaxID=337506 RepID=UPI003FCC6394